MAKVIRVPITNYFMGGDYTGRIVVGPAKVPMNVILDTGSSALALDGNKYSPALTQGDKSTRLAQTDSYGDGSSWTGAVINTTISVGEGAEPPLPDPPHRALLKHVLGDPDRLRAAAFGRDELIEVPADD